MAQAFQQQHRKPPRQQPCCQRAVFRLRHLGATQHVLRRGVRRGVWIGRGDLPLLGLGFVPSKAAFGFVTSCARRIKSRAFFRELGLVENACSARLRPASIGRMLLKTPACPFSVQRTSKTDAQNPQVNR
jgi:hypothetical protein